MEDGIKRGKILFFDPNNTTHEVDNNNNTLVSIFGGKELMKAPEDLSVSVDLEVINKSRRYIIDGGKNAIISSVASGKKTNFLSGMELGNTNVLSTYFTDIKYDETDNETLSEALSIKSIDIEFNSWYVATVTINFVDVRGAALFSPSEHNQMNPDDYLKDSPYSAFFTMPYPQFNLKVKGVYGDAVSYPLHLLDFKSSFNNSTGNFEINTSFIGYTYAILNDIQMTYLIAAPNLDLYGTSYWENEVARGRFLTLENTPLPKIPQMIENVIKGDYQLQKLTQKDSTIISSNQTKNKINDVGVILTELNNYVNKFRENVMINSGGTQYSFAFDDKDKNINKNEDILIIKNRIIGLVDEFNDKYPNEPLFTSKYYTNESDTEKDNRYDLSKKLLPESKKFDVIEFQKTLSDFKKNETNNLIELDGKVGDIILNGLTEVYGFKPSIYNFTKILLAHMETLLHVIAQTATVSQTNINRDSTNGKHETDLKDNKLGPFPWLTIDDKDAWMGDYPEYADYSEVKLVNSFHKAKTASTSLINKALSEEMSNYDTDLDANTAALVGDVWLPINAFDNSINIINGKKAPYSNFKNSSGSFNIDDIKSVLSSRMTTIAAFSPTYGDTLGAYAFAESINILNQIGYSETLINMFMVALEDTIEHIEHVLNLKTNKTNQQIFEVEGFNFLNTRGQLPLNDKTVTELKSNVEADNKFNNLVNYYEKNSINNVKIVDGENDCIAIYNDWYVSVKSLIDRSEKGNLVKTIEHYKLNKNDVIDGYLEQKDSDGSIIFGLPKGQPMLNRVGRVSINSIKFFRDIVDGDINLAINDVGLIGNFHNEHKSNDELLSLDLNIKNIIIKDDITDTDNFTYPLVGGVMKNWRGRKWWELRDIIAIDTKSFSLFGHPLYYTQGDRKDITIGKLAKAYLFLQTLPVNISSIEKSIKTGKNFMLRLPKVTLLFLGAVQWRKKYIHDNKMIDEDGNFIHNDPILEKHAFTAKNNVPSTPDSNQTYRQNNVFTLNIRNHSGDVYDYCDIPLDNSVSKKLIKYFTDWCSTIDNGWLQIKDVLEHRDDKGELFENSTQFNKYLDKLNLKDISDNTNSVYQLEEQTTTRLGVVRNEDEGKWRISLKSDRTFKTLNIIYKSSSKAVKTILKLLSEESIIAHTGEYNIFSTDTNDEEWINNLLGSVIRLSKDIKSNLKAHSVTKSSLEVNADSIGESTYDKNREMNLQTYKYLKSLYDKWVSGYEYNSDESEYKWINTKTSAVGDYKKTYDIKNFKFIDRSYNHIGQKFILNLKDVLSNIGLNEQKTLYTTITKVLSKNNFLFIAMPNYQPWNKASDFAKIFKPIPHHLSKMGVSNDMYNAQFLCMYTGELAKRLDSNNEYKDDILDLNIANNLTIAEDFNDEKVSDSEGQSELIKDQLESVPVFAVSYGKQNQQYFKNISLNQNNPATTEASVMAIERLVERNDKTTSIELITQDLYNIYSDYSYLCEIEMLGCAQIQPMMYFQLTNIPMWNGAYLIYKVKHSIQPGTMTTYITGMKMGKRYPDFITPKTITYGDFSNIYGGHEEVGIEINVKEKLKYFELGDYFKRYGSIPTPHMFPSNIVQRIKDISSPIINIIYKTWVEDKKQTEFVITSGYRSDSPTMHGQGLAVDIQITGKGIDEELHKNLFDHIKNLMKTREGFKIDQLISESHIAEPGRKRTYWVHVGVAYIEGNMISYRGEHFTNKDHKRITDIDIIDNAKSEPKFLPISSNTLLDEFIAFWKQAENDNSAENGAGWRSNEKKWYTYSDNKVPAIAYGLRIKNDMSNLKNKDELISGDKGITEGEAIEEVRHRINQAMRINEQEMVKEFSKEQWEQVDDIYKYILVDIRLNVGNIESFPRLKKAVIENDRENIKKESETKGDERRNKLKLKFMNRDFA